MSRPVGVRRVPVPVEVITVAVRWYLRYGAVLPGCGGAAGRTRRRGGSRDRLPVGAAIYPRCSPGPPARPRQDKPIPGFTALGRSVVERERQWRPAFRDEPPMRPGTSLLSVAEPVGCRNADAGGLHLFSTMSSSGSLDSAMLRSALCQPVKTDPARPLHPQVTGSQHRISTHRPCHDDRWAGNAWLQERPAPPCWRSGRGYR